MKRRILGIWAPKVDQAVDDELQFHVDRLTEALSAGGMAPDEARRQAMARFGSVPHIAAECETIDRNRALQLDREEWWSALRQDLHFAFRTLWRQRLVAIVTIVCLALGIAATTTVFSVANALLIRPLPYPNGDRLVSLGATRSGKLGSGVTSVRDLADWRNRSHTLSDIAGVSRDNFVLLDGQAEQVRGARVTANLFRAIGARPSAGRLFIDDDDRVGGPPIVVVSQGFASRHFGGVGQSAVGRTLRLNGEARTVVGVVPDRWSFPDGLELWVPLQPEIEKEARGNRFLQVIGVLGPDATVPSARTEFITIGRQLARDFPEDDAEYGVEVEPLRERYVGTARPAFRLLGGAALLLLLIACANVGSLQLSRATARSREIAIRMALGAGRGRLIRQLFTESVFLALVGGTVGVLLALEASHAVALAVAHTLPSWIHFTADWRVIGFTLGVSSLAGIGFGLAPASRLMNPAVSSALRSGGRGGVDRRTHRLHRALVVAEIALSVILLVGSGLAVLRVTRLQQITPGFDPAGVVTFRLSLLGPEFADDAPRAALIANAIDRIKHLPGVENAGAVTLLPIADCCSQFGFTVEGHPAARGHRPLATGNLITPDYLRTLHVPLLHGRFFGEADGADAPRVVLVSQTFAGTYWPKEDALGKRIQLEGSSWSVVGVVGDIRQTSLTDAPEPQFYMPHAQDPWESMRFAVRVSHGDPARLVPAIRSTLRALAPTVPVVTIRTMDTIVQDSIAGQRLYGLLLAGFSLVALSLATAGVYGVMSYFVAQRTHEIGIRMALGATAQGVGRLVLGQGMVIAGIGLLIGLAGAMAAARAFAHVLYGVRANEPVVYAVAAGVLACTAVIATYSPARRATGVDPMEALRSE